MRKIKSVVVIFCLAMLCALAVPNKMLADEWDKATKLTFNDAVEVPGTTLPAGTYWFTLVGSDSERNLVQIWNADRTRLVTTILAVPDYRLQPTGKTVINFEERSSDAPEAIHAWFYPGDNFGQEFVYPKTRAAALAKQANRPVLSLRDEQRADATQLKKAPVTAISPTGGEVDIAGVVGTKPVLAPSGNSKASSSKQ